MIMFKNKFVWIGTLFFLMPGLVFAVGGKQSGSSGGIDIGIVLPTVQENRWLGDQAKFREAITARGLKAEILFSNNNSATERTNVETFISRGAKIIVLCAYDAAAAAAAVRDAKTEGITVISYDRLIMGVNSIDYYVTFDSLKVGAAKAQFLVDKAGNTKGNNLYIYSGALTDNNSFIFFEGAWKLLQPKIADGTFVVQNCPAAVALKNKNSLSRDEYASIMSTIDSEWSMTVSKSLAEANLTASGKDAKGTVFVLGPADDDCARSLSDTFRADADVKTLYLTGADGVEASVQYVIDGKQSMTVYKDPGALVDATLNICEAVLKGQKYPTDTTYNNDAMDVPAVQCGVVTVTSDNIAQVFFESGVYEGSKYTGWK
jgi:putative multiple sugar transport system substrate-binding protein